MLSRLLPKPCHFRGAAHLLLPSKLQSFPLCNNSSFISPLRRLSTNNDDNNNQNDGFWKLTDPKYDPFFAAGSDSPSGEGGEESWLMEEGSGSSGSWETAAEAYKAWTLDEEEEGKKADELFDLGDVAGGIGDDGNGIGGAEDAERKVEMEALAEEEKALVSVLKGPNRAFGDLLAASGITDAMLHSLIALKDFEDVGGLPPLSEIEEMRYQKGTRRSIRAEMERQKQEEAAKARVRKVDEKGRAYGTGRRKCSIARVWIEPGEGKFLVNDKEFDVYFPMLDHRAALLQPFSETKTLGLWNVNCTVKGGGVSGQVGAIQLGVSRALQNWEPDLRPPLRSGGFLTRDSRVVERKKPGKAKARKSFQWVKR